MDLLPDLRRGFARDPMTDHAHFTRTLQEVRTWYNHMRPHDHLQGRTPLKSGLGLMCSRHALGEERARIAQAGDRNQGSGA